MLLLFVSGDDDWSAATGAVVNGWCLTALSPEIGSTVSTGVRGSKYRQSKAACTELAGETALLL